MNVQRGRCVCGDIEYQVEGEPLFIHACHCTQCQHRSGGAFCLSMMLTSDQFSLVRGAPVQLELRADSGNMKVNHVCPRCGTMLYGVTRARPYVTVVRPGTLDGAGHIIPQAHIWVRSKQPWISVNDVPCFEQAYDATTVWPQESLRRLEAARTRAG